MPTIKPFAALRPPAPLADKVAAVPYDVIDTAQARELIGDNPYSFLKVGRAEADLNPAIDLYDEAVYQRARANLEQMIADQTLVQDPKQCFYLYQLSTDDHSQTGLVALTAVDDYLSGLIKKHEHTRPDKEQDRAAHIDACNAQTGPIFMAYRDDSSIDQLLSRWQAEHQPAVSFLAPDGVQHTVWVIDDAPTKEGLAAAFGELGAFYIADGHHRTAAAAKIALQRRKADPDYTGGEPYNYILSVLFPQSQLKILDYNRVVRDLNGLSEEDFMARMGRRFRLAPCPDADACRPPLRRLFAMYFAGQWWSMRPSGHPPGGLLDGLDVSILQDAALRPILGIGDPRTDERISFIGGSRPLRELEELVDSGEMAVAFVLFPTAFSDVLAVADRGRVMPPKSTWFEPKLRDGLFVYRLQ